MLKILILINLQFEFVFLASSFSKKGGSLRCKGVVQNDFVSSERCLFKMQRP